MIRQHPLTLVRKKISIGACWGADEANGVDATQLVKEEDALRRRAGELADWLGRIERNRSNQRHKFLRRLRNLDLDTLKLKGWSCHDRAWNAACATFLEDLQAHRNRTQDYLHRLADVCRTRQAAAIELFRSTGPLGMSLNFVSPDLATAVKKLNAPSLVGKVSRKTTRGLGRVLLRSNTKSSPFAALNEVVVSANGDVIPQSVTAITPNPVHELCVFEALALSDALIDQVRFQVNSNYWNDGVVLHVVGQTIDATNRKVFRHRDRLCRVKLNGPILAVLRAEGEVLNVTYLQRRLGVGAREARSAMRVMVDLGLLSVGDHLTERLDGMAALLERMSRFELPEQGPVADTMDDLRAMHSLWLQMTDGYSAYLHNEYTAHFVRINERWGITGFDPRDALFLDQVSMADADTGLAEHQLDDLDALLPLAPAFDVNTLIQQELLWRVGGREQLANQDLADGNFFRLLTEVNLAYAGYWSNPFEHFESQCPQVNALQDVKRKLTELLRGRFTSDETVEIELFSEDVDYLCDLLPDEVSAHGYVYSVFGQPCPDGTLMINNFYPGHMSFMHRFTRHLELTEELRRRVRAFYHRKGEVPVEIYETMGFNANIYRTDHRERLLFDISRDRSDIDWFTDQIPLSSCRLVARGTGIGLDDGNELVRVPVLASSLIRVLYPGQVAFFAALFDNISFISGLAGVFLDGDGADGIVACPRIRFRSLVLERRQWLLRESATREFRIALGRWDAPLAVAAWLHAHRLPPRFYLRVRRTAFAGRVHNVAQEFQKPQFFDVDDLWLVQLAHSEVAGATEMLVSEELPHAYEPEFVTEVMTLVPDEGD